MLRNITHAIANEEKCPTNALQFTVCANYGAVRVAYLFFERNAHLDHFENDIFSRAFNAARSTS